MHAVIVEDDADFEILCVSVINGFEKVNEVSTVMCISDQSRYLSGKQIDAGQQGYGAVALILVITPPRAVLHRRRTVLRYIAYGLNSRFLIVGNKDLAAQFISSFTVADFGARHLEDPCDSLVEQ